MRAFWLAALACLAGCGSCEPDRSTPSASASASASSGAPAASPPPWVTHPPQHPPPQKLACRVIALDGEAHIEAEGSPDAGGPPLLLQGLAPTDAWFDLAKGTRVVAKDPRTTRETTFRGPARVRACVDYSEESWVASGRFESTVGAGETPGAEEWVVTPFGVVRYVAAKVAVEVGAREADVSVESGLAFAWGGQADAGAADEGWTRLPGGKFKLSAREDAAAAVDRCGELARTTRDLAAQIMTPGGGADGGVIVRQVTTRRLARAACAVASLRVNALSRADAMPLLHALAEANAAWSGLPDTRPP